MCQSANCHRRLNWAICCNVVDGCGDHSRLGKSAWAVLDSQSGCFSDGDCAVWSDGEERWVWAFLGSAACVISLGNRAKLTVGGILRHSDGDADWGLGLRLDLAGNGNVGGDRNVGRNARWWVWVVGDGDLGGARAVCERRWLAEHSLQDIRGSIPVMVKVSEAVAV